jgi:hypothetical protein
MVETRSVSDPAEPNVKIKIYYIKKGDHLKLGETQLDKMEYVFWRGKFAEARISATGPENFDRLKTFLFEKYGTVNKSQGAYFWDGSVTQIFFERCRGRQTLFADHRLNQHRLPGSQRYIR